MRLWNEFLTLLKRHHGFRGVRVLELHDEHGVHFHVLTDKRFPIRKMLDLGGRYGFGRTNVKTVKDVAGGVAYLCKYLSKRRPPCLKRVRLWAAFGEVERTRVSDIVSDSPFVRVLRETMGIASPDEILAAGREAPKKKPVCSFMKALSFALKRYYTSFDPDYSSRRAHWRKLQREGACGKAAPWIGFVPFSEDPA
jgi:hypothetical protein